MLSWIANDFVAASFLVESLIICHLLWTQLSLIVAPNHSEKKYNQMAKLRSNNEYG